MTENEADFADLLDAVIRQALEQLIYPQPVEAYGVLFAPDAWLPTFHDHSRWARSVRWSCGRPGYRPMFDHEKAYRDAIREEYARARIGAQILRPATPLRITDLGGIA